MKKLTIALSLLTFPFAFLNAQTGIINTIAGIAGAGGYNGDNIPATSAKLDTLSGVAVDAAGNVYIADQDNNRIRKISTTGIITTIAGIGGPPNYSGDGGQATSAELANPNDVRVNAAGVVYFSDGGNAIVREILTTGIIHTVAGNANFGGGYSGNGGPATSAELNFPVGICLDNANNLYIADQNNNVIREVTAAGIISTVAGNHTAGFSGNGGAATSAQLYNPTGVAVDNSGNMYIADYMNNEIRIVSGGTINAFAGNHIGGYNVSSGPATSTEIYNPTGVSVDAAGNVYLADPGDGYIREVIKTTNMMYVIAGNANDGFSGDAGPAVDAEIYYPFDVVTDASNNVYIADQVNNRVRKITASCSADVTTGLIYNYPGCANSTDGIIVATSNSPFSPYTYSWSPNSNTTDSAIHLSAGTYTLYISDAVGCSASSTVTLTAPPALIMTTSNYTICAGQNATMISSTTGGAGPYNYTWAINNWPYDSLTVDNVTTTTQYTVYAQDQNGCTDSAVSTVNVNQPTPISFYPDYYTVCTSSTTDMLNGSPSGGTFTGPGVTGTNFNGSLLPIGNYTVTYHYTDSNHCTDSIQNQIAVSACTGIQTIQNGGNIDIYPNPANEVVNITLPDNENTALISLYTLTGQEMFETKPGNKQTVVIPVSQLSQGVYFLKVTLTDGSVMMQKMEVAR